MKKLENKCMLITYSDSMGSNLKDLNNVLDKHFKDAIGGVHILPFFPSSGDRGFAPMDYHKVDSAFGDWTDIEKLADKYYLMFDYMINHISAHSEYYKDFLEKRISHNTQTFLYVIRISGKMESRRRNRLMQYTKENPAHHMWMHILQMAQQKRYGVRLTRNR